MKGSSSKATGFIESRRWWKTDARSLANSPRTTRPARALEEVWRRVCARGAGGVVSDPPLASVSVVGSGMQNTPGYASRMFRILADGNVNIDMITTSEIRISCIIKEEQAAEAVRLLHRGFELDREEQ